MLAATLKTLSRLYLRRRRQNGPASSPPDPQLLAQGVKAIIGRPGILYKRRVTDLSARGLREIRAFLLQRAGRARYDGWDSHSHPRLECATAIRKIDGRAYRGAAKTWARRHVAALRRRVKYDVAEKVKERLKGCKRKASFSRAKKFADLVTSMASHHHGGRKPGARSRLLEQAGTRGRRGKPGLGSRMREMFAAIDGVLRENRKSGRIIRRYEAGAGEW